MLLLMARDIQPNELDHNPFSKSGRMKALSAAIDEYYQGAFSPEILYALELVENSRVAAELVAKNLKLSGEEGGSSTAKESRFQVNLIYIQQQFERAIQDIKLRDNHVLFIDGIDIRPHGIEYQDYLECIKGLANAMWSLNNDFFPKIRDSKGRMRVVLLLRPDIFNSLGLQNTTNKVRDNSVYLDWRTTYPGYRTSRLFALTDRLLAAQQEIKLAPGAAWDYYFPWRATSTSPKRDMDDSFVRVLRLSYSRPRDVVSVLQILQEEFREKARPEAEVFREEDLRGNDFLNKYSEYLLGGIRDQLAFYYNEKDYEMFLKFFTFLDGRPDFTYEEYKNAYTKFTEYVLENHNSIPEFVESSDTFLQFLYDSNIICHIEDTEDDPLFRWCYRERGPSNISPKVGLDSRYQIHYGLYKALNVGGLKHRRKHRR